MDDITARRVAREVERAQKKESFLRCLNLGLSVCDACATMGIGRRTVYRWHSTDPEFAQAWKVALITGRVVRVRKVRSLQRGT